MSEMQIAIFSGGGPALVAEQHFDQAPMQARLIWSKPAHKLCNVENGVPATC